MGFFLLRCVSRGGGGRAGGRGLVGLPATTSRPGKVRLGCPQPPPFDTAAAACRVAAWPPRVSSTPMARRPSRARVEMGGGLAAIEGGRHARACARPRAGANNKGGGRGATPEPRDLEGEGKALLRALFGQLMGPLPERERHLSERVRGARRPVTLAPLPHSAANASRLCQAAPPHPRR
ncbi:unnamed protein product [Lampetra fluviatilis]